jgi:hypothetical protein
MPKYKVESGDGEFDLETRFDPNKPYSHWMCAATYKGKKWAESLWVYSPQIAICDVLQTMSFKEGVIRFQGFRIVVSFLSWQTYRVMVDRNGYHVFGHDDETPGDVLYEAIRFILEESE